MGRSHASSTIRLHLDVAPMQVVRRSQDFSVQLGSYSSTRTRERSGRCREISSSGDMHGLELGRQATYGRQWHAGTLEVRHAIVMATVLECSILGFFAFSLPLLGLLPICSRGCGLHGDGRCGGA